MKEKTLRMLLPTVLSLIFDPLFECSCIKGKLGKETVIISGVYDQSIHGPQILQKMLKYKGTEHLSDTHI